jgi:two-component system, sensor histidine kinase and response regulator
MTTVVILIADDDTAIAETLALVVEEHGYIALVAHNGLEALELARENRPELVVTDLMMPKMDGAELAATLRADARHEGKRPPRILLVSAAGQNAITRVEADAVLHKPFDLLEVESMLDALLS